MNMLFSFAVIIVRAAGFEPAKMSVPKTDVLDQTSPRPIDFKDLVELVVVLVASGLGS